MEIAPAYRIALLSGIALCGQDPDQVLPLRGVINDQQPTAGTPVWSGDPVTISVQNDPAPSTQARPCRTRPGCR